MTKTTFIFTFALALIPPDDEQNTLNWKIIQEGPKRFDNGLYYYVLIDAISLKNAEFKLQIETTIRQITKKYGQKLTLEIFDNLDALTLAYKQYGDFSLKRQLTNTETEQLAVHDIALYSGENKADWALYTLVYFPAAIKSHHIVGNYLESIEFKP